MTRHGLIITAFIFLLTACSPASVEMKNDNQTTTDRQELIQKAMRFALIEEKIPDYNLIRDKKNIVLSTENLFAHEMPEIEGITFLFLTENQIQQKADHEGDFLHLVLQDMKIEGNEAVLSLENRWAVSKQSKEMGVGYLSGGGFELGFHKKKGKWIMEDVMREWIS